MTTEPHLRHFIGALFGRRYCATADCDGRAYYEADIYDGFSDEPVVAPYCLACAITLHNGGEQVRALSRRRL